MTRHEEQARSIVQSIVNIYPSTVGIIGPDYEPGQRMISAIATALRDTERRVWERVIENLEYRHRTKVGLVYMFDAQSIFNWCRAKAAQEE